MQILTSKKTEGEEEPGTGLCPPVATWLWFDKNSVIGPASGTQVYAARILGILLYMYYMFGLPEAAQLLNVCQTMNGVATGAYQALLLLQFSVCNYT